MKTNGYNNLIENLAELNHHVKAENPLHDDAFSISDETKIELISEKFKEVLHIIGLDLNDDSISETPHRIAKMYINEIFRGLNPKNRPEITLFKNKYNYKTPLIELNIPFTSFCEHHFVPIIGKANMAYIPNDFVIGLSKIHRLVDYYARRPQVQERLTQQIFEDFKKTLLTEDVGIVIKAHHSCISCRGVKDQDSATITSVFSGKVNQKENIINYLLNN